MKQSGSFVAFQQREIKNVEVGWLGEGDPFVFNKFLYFFFFGQGDKHVPIGDDPGCLVCKGIIVAKRFAQGLGYGGAIVGTLIVKFCNDAVDPILIGMKSVEAKLIGKDGKDQDSGGDPQGKTSNIDSGISPVA